MTSSDHNTAGAKSSPSAAEDILTVHGVSHAFGGVRALDECSLSVRRGSLTALIGPNGAGKSTLIEIISGSMRPQHGTVTFNGHDVTGLPSYRLAGLGLFRTYQHSREFAALTVLENLLVVDRSADDTLSGALLRRGQMKRRRREAVDRAREILARFDLDNMRNEYAAILSGGQKRLLELARAVICNPVLLLLDEPMAGVNPALIERLERHLADLRTSLETTIVIVEHNLEVVDRISDWVIVMADGKTLASGSMLDHRSNADVLHAYLGGSA